MAVDLNSIEAFDPSLRAGLKETLSAMDQLSDLTQQVNASMSEYEFKTKFLPLLINKEDGDKSMEFWWNRIGNPMIGIDILGPNKEVLFKAPPLMRTHANSSIDSGKMSLSEIITTASKKSEIIPNMGNRYIKEHITNRIKPIEEFNDLKAWNAILIRYGYNPIIDESELELPEESKKLTRSEFTDDDFEDL